MYSANGKCWTSRRRERTPSSIEAHYLKLKFRNYVDLRARTKNNQRFLLKLNRNGMTPCDIKQILISSYMYPVYFLPLWNVKNNLWNIHAKFQVFVWIISKYNSLFETPEIFSGYLHNISSFKLQISSCHHPIQLIVKIKWPELYNADYCHQEQVKIDSDMQKATNFIQLT